MINKILIVLALLFWANQVSAIDLPNNTGSIQPTLRFGAPYHGIFTDYANPVYVENGFDYDGVFTSFYSRLTSANTFTPLTVSNSYGKLYSQDNRKFYCAYTISETGAGYIILKASVPSNFQCPDRAPLPGFTSTPGYLQNYGALNGGGNSPPVNTVQPITQEIAGLVCETYLLPNIDQVGWYTDYGSLPNRTVTRDEQNTILQNGTGGTANQDIFAVFGASSGATLPIGSISFTGSTYANVTSIGTNNEAPSLYGWIKRDGAMAGWNILQIRGVNTSGFFGKYGNFVGSTMNDGTTRTIMYSSGGVAEANLTNNEIGKYFEVYSPTSGFSGVRIGYAQYEQRKSCSLPNINSCEWKIEGGKNKCGPEIKNNFEVGICNVSGSGSIYGSGSCVPVVDLSGNVVDAGILPGEGTVITLPDGTTRLVRTGTLLGSSELFACPKSKDAPWYKYLFACGGEVVGNIYGSVTGSTQALVTGQLGTYSNDRLYTGSFSGITSAPLGGAQGLVGSGARTSNSPLLLAIKTKLDTVGTPGPEIWQRMFTGGLAVGILIMILSILGMIVGSIRNRDNITKK